MMSPSELRAAYARLNKEQDQELDKLELDISQRYRLRRRELFKSAGEQTAIGAELEEAYYDLFPPASAVPEGTPLVQID
jgi:hypothetical protein